MSEEASSAIFVILGLIFQEKVPPALAGVFGLNELQIKLLCWVVLIAAYLLLNWFLRRGWRSIGTLRRRWFPVASFEGVWVQSVSNERRPFSLACIEYDATRRQWDYRGVAFDAALVLKASWQTSGIHFDPRRRAWHFAGDGKLLQVAKGVVKETNSFDIAVVLTLPKDLKHSEIRAKAADFNFDTDPNKEEERIFTITLKRIEADRGILDAIPGMTLPQRQMLFRPIRPIKSAASAP